MKRIVVLLSVFLAAASIFLLRFSYSSAAPEAPYHSGMASAQAQKFTHFPVDQRRPVEFEYDKSALAGLSQRQARDQFLDWLLYTVVTDAGVSTAKVREILFDVPPLRRGYLSQVANYDYGRTRSRVIEDTAIAIIPATDNAAERLDYVGELADEYVKNAGQRPSTVEIFEYEIDPSGTQAWITRRTPVSGQEAFSASYGYIEQHVGSRDEMASFLAAIHDLAGARLKDGVLVLSGRKLHSAAYNGVTLEDVAAIWQSEKAVEAGIQKIQDFESRWKTRTYRGEEEKTRLKAEYEHELEALRAEIPTGVTKRGGGSGFSLDPAYEFDTLKENLSTYESMLRSLAAENGAPITGEEIDQTLAAVDQEDPIPFLRLVEKLQTSDDRRLMRLTDQLQDVNLKSEYQAARYDGKLQGTEVGMTLFYTDLLAKLWALDFQNKAPRESIEDFVPLLRVSTASIYEKERRRLHNTRLWFGPQDAGFQTSESGVRFARTATRVYAASSNPTEPGKEEEPNAHSAAFLGWWNDHYDEIATFEPQYQRLNEIMKWSVVLGWLNQKSQFQLLDYLGAVEVRRDLWFADWVNEHEKLRYRDWSHVTFYPRGYRGVATETMPLLKWTGEHDHWLAGGVSLALREKIAARALLSDDVPLLVRRANLNYAEFSANRFVTLEKTAYTFDDVLTGVKTRVVAEVKEAAKLRNPNLELKRTSFEFTFAHEGEALIADANAGGAPVARLAIEPRADVFRVAFRSLDTENVAYIAQRIAAEGLTGDAAEVALRSYRPVDSLVRFADNHFAVKLRGSGRWAEIRAEDLSEEAKTTMRAGAPSDDHQWDITWRQPSELKTSLGETDYVVLRPAGESKAFAVEARAHGPPTGTREVTYDAGGTRIAALQDDATGLIYVRRANIPTRTLDDLSLLRNADQSIAFDRLARRFSDGEFTGILDDITADPVQFKTVLEAQRTEAYAQAANDIAEGRFFDASGRIENAQRLFGSDADQSMLHSMMKLLSDHIDDAAHEMARAKGPLRGWDGIRNAIDVRLLDQEMSPLQRQNLSRLAEWAYARNHGIGRFELLPVAREGHFDLQARLLTDFEKLPVAPAELRKQAVYVEIGSRLDQPGLSLRTTMDELGMRNDIAVAFKMKDSALARAHPDAIQTAGGTRYRLVQESVRHGSHTARLSNETCSGDDTETGGCEDSIILLPAKAQ